VRRERAARTSALEGDRQIGTFGPNRVRSRIEILCSQSSILNPRSSILNPRSSVARRRAGALPVRRLASYNPQADASGAKLA